MDKLSREEVKELVEKISYGMGSDEEVSEWIQKIMDSVPNRNVRKENNGYNDDINTFISLFNPRPDIFTANLPIDILIENLNKFQVLSGTTAYKSLQNISYRK